LEVVKKQEAGLVRRLTMPKCPAVEIDGVLVSEGREISKEELEKAIISRLG